MNQTRKFKFFGRIKNAVFQLERYGVFLGERFSTSLKYALLLILIVTIATTIAETYNFSNMVEKGFKYVDYELPDFTLENNVLSFDEVIEGYDEEFKFYFFVNTDQNITDDSIRNYLSKSSEGDYGLIVLYDRILYKVGGVEMEQRYEEFMSQYDSKVMDKEMLLDEYNSLGIRNICTVFFVVILTGQYMVNILQIFADLILVAILGHITARICKIKLKMSSMLTLSIYAMTLSIILNTIYVVIRILTGFSINYFRIMYLLIAYVYIVAAMLMIKTDIIKCNEELAIALEMQKKMKKEEEEKKQEEQEEQEKKEQEKEKKKKEEKEQEEKELDREPDGSEI